MDLAVVIPFLDKYGGAERYAVECIRAWQHRHKITVYSTSISEPLLAEHGIRDHVTRRLLTPYFEGEHAMVLNAVLLPKVWRDEIGRHDLFHTHLWPTHLIDLHPMVWYPHEPFRVLHDLRYEQPAREDGDGIARHVHIYPKYTYDLLDSTLYDASLSAIGAADRGVRPDRIVANSRYTAGYLKEVYGGHVGDVVYPGVSLGDQGTAGQAESTLGEDPDLFVTISQLWSHKRVHLLVEAVAHTRSAKLLVIGSGPEREWLEALAVRLKVESRVRFESGLSNNQLRQALAAARAFVFAPVKEPFGIVVLEAMAAGKPVIAVAEGGYSEVCNPHNAFLLPPSPAAFAEKMELLQRDTALANAMGEAGRAAAAAYTWDRAATELEAMLEATLSGHRSMMADAHGAHSDRTLVGAQYYLWYGEGFGAAHWGDTARSGRVEDSPLLGYYGSTRGQIIESHMSLMEDMGLDYAVLNLHLDELGPNKTELLAIRHVFEIARARNSPLKFAIQLAPYTDRLDDLAEAIGLIVENYRDHPNYLRLDGRPVLFWFWSTAHDGQVGFFERMARAAAGFTNIAASLRLPDDKKEDLLTFGFFDGFAPFSPLELSERKNWQMVWSAAWHAAEQAGMRWRVASISPGYDDSALDDPQRTRNPYRVIPRNAGDTYREGMHFIDRLHRPAHLVLISTFNEFHENTHIEPSRHCGTLYADLTREFTARLKARP